MAEGAFNEWLVQPLRRRLQQRVHAVQDRAVAEKTVRQQTQLRVALRGPGHIFRETEGHHYVLLAPRA
jgi:hypothetical protein